MSFAQLSYSAIDVLSLTIVIAGILVQARVGIGFALLSAPALFIINENYMPGPILILGFLLSLLMYLNEHRPLEIRTVLPAILARIPGSWCGVLTLAYLPQWLLGVVIAISLLVASLASSVRTSIRLTRPNLVIAGLLSGFSGTVTSIGGPIMALLYQAQTPDVTRNALLSFFLVGTPISILLLMLANGMSQEAYILCIKMLPGVIIGYRLSRFKWLAFIAPSRTTIMALSIFSAAVILLKSLSMIT